MYDPRDPWNEHGQLSVELLRQVAEQAALAGSLTVGGGYVSAAPGALVVTPPVVSPSNQTSTFSGCAMAVDKASFVVPNNSAGVVGGVFVPFDKTLYNTGQYTPFSTATSSGITINQGGYYRISFSMLWRVLPYPALGTMTRGDCLGSMDAIAAVAGATGSVFELMYAHDRIIVQPPGPQPFATYSQNSTLFPVWGVTAFTGTILVPAPGGLPLPVTVKVTVSQYNEVPLASGLSGFDMTISTFGGADAAPQHTIWLAVEALGAAA